jgi:hypothetical protein
MPQPRIALVTCVDYPHLTQDDQILVEALRSAGYQPIAEEWDRPAAPWESYGAVIIRSPWDYFHRVPEFLGWLDSLQGRPIRLFNPLRTLRWNVRKTYLREIEAAGVPIVPTHWVAEGSTLSLRAICEERGWTEVVVKPTYSGTAFGTWRAGPVITPADDARLLAAAAEREQMIQPFVREVQTGGEHSLIFFGGRYSHAVLKRPASGDFRVQADFGGSVNLVDAGPGLLAQAERVLRQAPTPCLYARVDGCLVGKVFQLMELEVLEPTLFFGLAPHSADRFVEALAAMP